ncbi:unnamed protein product, partial [Ectocarpus sp. 12 AP-2014]
SRQACACSASTQALKLLSPAARIGSQNTILLCHTTRLPKEQSTYLVDDPLSLLTPMRPPPSEAFRDYYNTSSGFSVLCPCSSSWSSLSSPAPGPGRPERGTSRPERGTSRPEQPPARRRSRRRSGAEPGRAAEQT